MSQTNEFSTEVGVQQRMDAGHFALGFTQNSDASVKAFADAESFIAKISEKIEDIPAL